jgi:hypothetical protein
MMMKPTTGAGMDEYLNENGYISDIEDFRMHHEIYLSDIHKVEPSKWRTVICHSIRKS